MRLSRYLYRAARVSRDAEAIASGVCNQTVQGSTHWYQLDGPATGGAGMSATHRQAYLHRLG
jgi:hypothetical protein